MSKFRRSGSDESSSSFSDDESKVQSPRSEVGEEEELEGWTSDTEISPLAMMKESSPEAWLGQFLVVLELRTRRSTLEGAMRDADLIAKLQEIRETLALNAPLELLDPEQADRLRAEDWGRWFKGQDVLYKYCCATMALSLLGDRRYASELELMHRQEANARIKKDAHYVLCHLLGKTWPGGEVTEGDVARLRAEGAGGVPGD
jgi:hypothetical protein